MRCAHETFFTLLYAAATVSISYSSGYLVAWLTESFVAGWVLSSFVYLLAAYEWCQVEQMAKELANDGDDL